MQRTLCLLVVLSLAAGGLAGCVDLGVDSLEPSTGANPAPASLTEAVFGFGDFLRLKVPSHDGVEIHVDVQLPQGDGPFPVLVEFTPYSLLGGEDYGAAADLGRTGEDNRFLPWEMAYFVPRGYAYAIAHVRGTGESGGCLEVGSPNEGLDGYAVVESLANESWSSGRVAMMGTSYVGTTPLQTAVLDPPHLEAIVPISAVTSWYRYYFENGEQRVNGDLPPGSSYTDPAFWYSLGVTPGPRTGATSGAEDVRCVTEYTTQFWLQDDYNDYWQARNHLEKLGNITTPVLYAHGFLDENTATSMLTDFWDRIEAPKRMWLGQHGHGVPRSSASFEGGEAFWSYVHRWLDHHLLERTNGAYDLPPVLVQDNRGDWRAEATWPPANTTPVRFHLAADGGLAPEAPAEGEAAYTDLGAADRPELRLPTTGTDRLRFVSDPLEAPLHLAGEPLMHLEAASSAMDTQFTVLVYDVAPDGTETYVTRGHLDARHRETLETGEDLAPGERYAFEWQLHPRDHHVAEGHRLAVVVKSSDGYVIPDETRAVNTLFFGAEGSWIELPTIDPATRAYSADVPLPVTWS